MRTRPDRAKSSSSESRNVRKSGATATSANAPSMQHAATLSPSRTLAPSGALARSRPPRCRVRTAAAASPGVLPRVWRTSGNDTPAVCTSTITPRPGVSMCDAWARAHPPRRAPTRGRSGRRSVRLASRGNVHQLGERVLARAACSPSRLRQMHHGARAPRPPALAVAVRRAQPRERVANAHVAGEESVRVAQGAHRDVRGPPGIATSARRVSASSAPGSRRSSPPAARRATASRAFPRVRGNGRAAGSASARAARVGKPVGQAAAAHHRLPVVRGHAAEHRARACHRDLLAHDRPRGHLEAVDRAGHTHSGAASHERPEWSPELGVDRTRRPGRTRLQRSAASPASSWSSSPARSAPGGRGRYGDHAAPVLQGERDDRCRR